MIFNSAVKNNSFVYCSVYQSPHETTNYYNTGNGHYHQAIYIVEGGARTVLADAETATGNETPIDLIAGNFYDLTGGHGKHVITKTEDVGMSMIMFNPIPETKKLKFEILKGAQRRVITAGDQRITVVCVTGPVQIKNKELASMQFAVVFSETSAELIMGEHHICILVTG